MADTTFNNVKITSEFTEAKVRENIVSGETLGTIFGKIQKNIRDLSDTAFDGNADTLDGKHVSDIMLDATSESSEMVALDGLQGGVPFSSITVSGENHINLTDYTAFPHVTASTAVGGSDSLTVSYSDSIARSWTDVTYKTPVKPNTDYHLKFTADNATGVTGCMVRQSDKSEFSPHVSKFGGNEFSLSFNSGDNDIVYIYLYSNASSTTMTEASVTYHNIMLSEDENAEYVPEIIGQEITLTASGKNLLKYPYVKTTSTINGITFTDNGDGSITMNGTAAAITWYSSVQQLRLQKGKQYCFSTGTPATTGVNPTDNGGYTMYLSFTENAGDSVVKQYAFPNVGSENIVFTAYYNYANLSIRVENGAQLNNVTFKPQLEIGGAATEYEPYSGSTIAITPDSNPYTVPNDIRQQEGINNVSVSTGEITVSGVKKSPTINRVWEEIDNKANLSDIPTSLPANGGNADTINGKRINCNIYTHPVQFGITAADTADDIWKALPDSSIFMAGQSLFTNTSWSFPSGTATFTLVMIKLTAQRTGGIYLYPKNTTGNIYHAVLDNDGNFKAVWYKINDGGDAATLGSHPASDFVLKTEYDALAARVAALENGSTT